MTASGEQRPEEQGPREQEPAEDRPAPPGYWPAPGGYGFVPEDYRWEDTPAPPGPDSTGYGTPGPSTTGYGNTGYGTTGYGTPAPATKPELAHWVDRVMSGLIDFFVPYFVGVYLYLFGDDRAAALVLLAAAGWGLYNGYLQGVTGQSVGKRVLGLRTVRVQDGRPLGGGQGFGRAFLHLLDLVPCGLGFLMPVWDDKRQTLADKVMGTVVVRA